jgi:hypothetical protein
LKLESDILLSTFAFNFGMCRYKSGRHDGLRREKSRARPLQGEEVQVEPMKPVLKAPAPYRLKLTHDELLSSFACNFNLRRFKVSVEPMTSHVKAPGA